MHKITEEKVISYFDNTLPQNERHFVEKWLKENADTPEANEYLAQLWEHIPEGGNSVESLKAFYKFKSKVVGLRSRTRSRMFTMIQRIAAVIAIPLLMLSTYLYIELNQTHIIYNEFFVANGQRDSITLSDNTIVWLNSGSRLIYPSKFKGHERNVFITGEGYFDVAKNPSKPFNVSIGNLRVKVLGTQFNVNSYEEGSAVNVKLIEGAVEINANINNQNHLAKLLPGDMLIYDKLEKQMSVSQFDLEDHCFWHHGELAFVNQDLQSITTQLSRCFNVKICITDEKLLTTKYNVSFVNNESLEDMLNMLNHDNTMVIHKDNNVIYINAN